MRLNKDDMLLKQLGILKGIEQRLDTMIDHMKKELNTDDHKDAEVVYTQRVPKEWVNDFNFLKSIDKIRDEETGDVLHDVMTAQTAIISELRKENEELKEKNGRLMDTIIRDRMARNE